MTEKCCSAASVSNVDFCNEWYGKWFKPRSLSRLCGLIVRVRVVPRRTVVGDIDRRFDNCVSSVYGIYVSGQLNRHVVGCWFVKSCCYLLRRLLETIPTIVVN